MPSLSLPDLPRPQPPPAPGDRVRALWTKLREIVERVRSRRGVRTPPFVVFVLVVSVASLAAITMSAVALARVHDRSESAPRGDTDLPAAAELALDRAPARSVGSPSSSRAGPVAAPNAAPGAPVSETTQPGAPPLHESDENGSTRLPPDDAIFTVHVAGAVKNPGVYSLPAATRVNDAVSAAGGLAGDADADAVNLAARLVDAARIFVPYRGRPVPSVVPTPEVSSTAEITAGASGLPGDQNMAPGMVNLNTADVTALDALPGVGPATAAAIVEYRQRNGPFRSVSQLLDVSGIGDAKLANIRSRVTV